MQYTVRDLSVRRTFLAVLLNDIYVYEFMTASNLKNTSLNCSESMKTAIWNFSEHIVVQVQYVASLIRLLASYCEEKEEFRMAPFGDVTCSNYVLLQFAVSEFCMDRALANLNETLRLCRFVNMLDEPNLFLVYVTLTLEFWSKWFGGVRGRDIGCENGFSDHLSTNLKLVDILMARLEILVMKAGLQGLIDELYSRGVKAAKKRGKSLKF